MGNGLSGRNPNAKSPEAIYRKESDRFSGACASDAVVNFDPNESDGKFMTRQYLTASSFYDPIDIVPFCRPASAGAHRPSPLPVLFDNDSQSDRSETLRRMSSGHTRTFFLLLEPP